MRPQILLDQEEDAASAVVQMRPTRNQTMLRMAQVIAKRGTCDRKQVGAVIAREGRVISVGYNGAPPGLPHCSENMHGHISTWEDIKKSCMRNDGMSKEDAEHWADDRLKYEVGTGCRNATHAEANALSFAAKYGVSTDGAELFVTVSPCLDCARLLIASGIESVFYLEAYRESQGITLLEAARIPCRQSVDP